MKAHWYNTPNFSLFLQDPISESTRRQRMCLLLTAMVGIFFAHTGLVPKEISVLGIAFTTNERLAWWIILALIVFYFLFAFGLYSLTDYISWRRNARTDLIRKAHEEIVGSKKEAKKPPLGATSATARKVGARYATPYRIEPRLWTVRCAFDLILPIAVGVYAIIALLLSAFR